MSGNPFNLHEVVDGDFQVERTTTRIYGMFTKPEINWNENQGYEFLTLDEILEQVMKAQDGILKDRVPFIRVEYETGLWGVIFEAGNYHEAGKQWLVHGVTKGYA